MTKNEITSALDYLAIHCQSSAERQAITRSTAARLAGQLRDISDRAIASTPRPTEGPLSRQLLTLIKSIDMDGYGRTYAGVDSMAEKLTCTASYLTSLIFELKEGHEVDVQAVFFITKGPHGVLLSFNSL